MGSLILSILLLTAAAPAQERYPLSCFYAPRGGELDSYPDCASIDAEGHVHLARKHFRQLDFDSHGLAAVTVGPGFYYLRRDGRSAPVMMRDNGPEAFSQGRARSEVNGKVGFIDRSLRLVIPRRYDGAMPFEKGSAEVCTGCAVASDGEHSWYTGGHWVRIDRRGRQQP